MIKKISICVLVVCAIPSITFASWWNPSTWFSRMFRANNDDRVEYLEKRILELESVIKIASSTSKDLIVSTPTITEVVPHTINKDSKTEIKDATIKKIEKSNLSVQPKEVTLGIDTHSAFLDLYSQYLSLNNIIDVDISKNTNTKSVAREIYVSNLKSYQVGLREAISGLEKLANLKNKPESDIYRYKTLLAGVRSQYYNESKRHTKALLIEYFVDNREYLGDENIHIQAAKLLDGYDREFGTKYSGPFKLTKTRVESIEFVDSMLVDLRSE